MAKIILVANTDWYLYNFRSTLAQCLRDQGFEVVLVSPPGKYVPVFQERGFRWIAWEVGRQTFLPWKEIPAFVRLAKIYRQEEASLIHHHTIKPVLYGSLVARLIGIDNVVNSITGRGYVFLGKDQKAFWLRQAAKILYRLALGHPNYAAIFENDPDRQYFITEKFIPQERAFLIPGVGVDIDRFTPVPEPEGTPIVLFSGRMLWDKGIGILVEAARILHKKLAVRIALVGEPDPGNPASIGENNLQAWTQEGVAEWWGWQPEMSSIYAKSHIVAAPTMYGEGVPTVLLEAAASGRPVVTTDMPGCRDVVIDGTNGFVIPPGDPQALAAALERLIADADLRVRMGSAGRQLVSGKFTTSQVNLATLTVYRNVMG